jgi:hypothetical protein
VTQTSFTTALPSDGSPVGFGASDIRNAKRQIQRTLEDSSNFLNTDIPVKAGAARPGVVTTALVFDDSKTTTPWQYDQALVLRSDTSRMYSYASITGPFAPHSSSTWRLGTPNYIGCADTTWPEATWVELSGVTAISSANGDYTTSFGLNNGYDGIPTVQLQCSDNGVALYRATIYEVQQTSFKYYLRPMSGTASNVTIHWTSLGTKAGSV